MIHIQEATTEDSLRQIEPPVGGAGNIHINTTTCQLQDTRGDAGDAETIAECRTIGESHLNISGQVVQNPFNI